MKNRYTSRLLLVLGALMAATSLASCGTEEEGLTLRLLNCEDYIGEDAFDYVDEDGNEYSFDDVLSGFEEYESEKLGKKVTIVYDTYDTNETMLSSLKTGKSVYDLITASDYTIQKMMSLGMLQSIDFDRVPNYVSYCSPYLLGQLDALTAEIDGQTCSVGDYAVGYMWGTLGILYNPAKIAADKGLDEDEVKLAMNDWNSLWDERFHGEMSVKDSMRDTYSVGIMAEFQDDILAAMQASGCFDENLDLIPGKWDEAVENYSPKLAEIFNRCGEEDVEKVKETLLRLKENIFGFEVDSGKEDIVKGMIGINLAWSGDAVYATDTAEDPEANNPQTLYYSIPKTGGNIWFDGWMMTKQCEGERQQAAYDFLNFISDPQVARANMEYIGYTPFIGGNTILDLVRNWYDPRYYDLDDVADFDPAGREEEDGSITPWETVAEEEEWDIVDLSYMFEGTLDEVPDVLGDDPFTNPYLFFTDALETIEGEDSSCVAGRQFFAQYPPEDLIPKLAIMKDYGDNNRYVLAMWQDVKSNNLPLAGVIVFGIILAALAVVGIGSVVVKRRYRKLRVARRKAAIASANKQ